MIALRLAVRRHAPSARRCFVAALAIATASCFYDSRWGDAKRAQQNAAARATPATLSARPPEDEPHAPTRTLRIRVRATPRYAAQAIDWQKQTADVIDDANKVLAPALAMRLEVAAMETWSPPPQEGALDASLATLRATDAASDVDIVVGIIGGIPKHTASFHDLGFAYVLGKHVVVRAAQSAEDYDAIEKGLDELSDEERKRLRRERQRHRATAVFLHEIGHVLGGVHEASATSLMHPSYRSSMSGFSDDGALLMRAVIAHRGEADPRPLAKDLIARIEGAAPSTWEPHDRDDTLARLRAVAAQEPPSPNASAPTVDAGSSAVNDDAVAALTPADRATYARANTALQGAHVDEALAIARPLFDAYPNVYAVQDLRCQLATLRQLDAAKVKAECARMLELHRGRRDAG